jgi:hypothetical protein
MLAEQAGAHAFVQRYTPLEHATHTDVSKAAARRARSCRYLSSSIKFGKKVDSYLGQFVDQGWLDLSYACDPQFEELLAQGDKAATAAHNIRNELLRAGFVATESQVHAMALGWCPILDLVGYNRVGESVIVELKCGRSSMDISTSSGSMRAPFDTLNYNGHTKAMMQLAVQRTCLSSIRGRGTAVQHAWLLTHAFSPSQCTARIFIRKLPDIILELVESVLYESYK